MKLEVIENKDTAQYEVWIGDFLKSTHSTKDKALYWAEFDAEQIRKNIPTVGDHGALMTSYEMTVLITALTTAKGNRTQAAKLLNMKRTTLVEKIKKLQIEGVLGDGR